MSLTGAAWTRLRAKVTSTTLMGGAVGLTLALVLTRDGMALHPDSAYYRSSAQRWAHGDFAATHLLPPFTRFELPEIARAAARLPFVDFPVGYPMAWGALGSIIGVDRAGHLLNLAAATVIAAAFASVLHGRASRRASLMLAAIITAGVTLTPELARSIQSLQSEPALAAVIALTIALGLRRLRDERSTRALWLIAGLGGLVRFVGVAVLFVPMFVESRRAGSRRRPLYLAVLAATPSIGNVAWASMKGGSRTRLHGFNSGDLREARFTVLGWFWGPADLTARGFSIDPGWFSGVLLVVAVLGFAALAARALCRRDDVMILCLGAAAVQAFALAVGMVLFDGFVSFTPRMLTPTLVCLSFAGLEGVCRMAGGRHGVRSAAVVVAAWLLIAVAPWTAFAHRLPPIRWHVDEAVAELVDGRQPAFVISNVAIDIAMVLGVPAAHLPQGGNSVTGEPTDFASQFDGLSCLLLRHDGSIIVAAGEVWVAPSPEVQAWLDSETLAEHMTAIEVKGAVRYDATASACTRP